jgi:hypothetical protein
MFHLRPSRESLLHCIIPSGRAEVGQKHQIDNVRDVSGVPAIASDFCAARPTKWHDQ